MCDSYAEEWIDKDIKQAIKEPVWEILVPASSKDKDFSYEHHKEFDRYVREKAGGITVMRAAKGEWIAPDGRLYKDRIIPCRICCSENDIMSIMNFAIKHYKQKAIMSFKISNEAIMVSE